MQPTAEVTRGAKVLRSDGLAISSNGHDRVEVHPMDQYNQELVNNAHPATWVNPTPAPMYNLVIIGAGSGGLIAAAGAAGLGAKVAVIERHLMGGDCLNTGCVPSKSVIRSAKVIGEIKQAAEKGIFVDPAAVQVDFGKVMERMRRIRGELSEHDSVYRFTKAGADVFLGSGRFAGPDTIEVVRRDEKQVLRFKKAVIATGSRPRRPAIPGLDEAGYITNEDVFTLTEKPNRLAVIGVGPIGCELAHAFLRFGVEVTLFGNKGRIMEREDMDAAQVVMDTFTREGMKFALNAKIKAVRNSSAGKTIVYELDGQSLELTVDEILVAIGRSPNIEGLNLEAAGIAYTDRGITVNDTLQTTNPNVYGVGDVALKYQFTHAADATARLVLQNALFPGPKKKMSSLVMPWCTYTDPEIAHVGIYEHDAKEQGIAIETLTFSLGETDRGRADGETEGFVRVHVKKGSDKVLGATIVASHAGEMINELSLAIVAGIGLKTIATVIHPYPTQAEGIKKVADLYNRNRLTPLVKGIFRRWFQWSRR